MRQTLKLWQDSQREASFLKEGGWPQKLATLSFGKLLEDSIAGIDVV